MPTRFIRRRDVSGYRGSDSRLRCSHAQNRWFKQCNRRNSISRARRRCSNCDAPARLPRQGEVPSGPAPSASEHSAAEFDRMALPSARPQCYPHHGSLVPRACVSTRFGVPVTTRVIGRRRADTVWCRGRDTNQDLDPNPQSGRFRCIRKPVDAHATSSKSSCLRVPASNDPNTSPKRP